MAGILLSEPPGDLLRRPVLLEFNRNDPLQPPVRGEQAELWTPCCFPGRTVGLSGPIAPPSSMPSHFLAHCGNGTVKTPGNGAECVTRSNAARDLFALAKTEYRWRPTPLCWRDPTSGF